MQKSVTHYIRTRLGLIHVYYTALIEPLPCPYCSGQKKVPKLLKRQETKND